jgi:cytochrome c oxidase accessory protein FixG
LYEKHKKVYAKAVRGYFDNWRVAMVLITQVLYYGLCWLPWNDRQAVLFHLVERKFYLFGLVLWPQDVIYLAILLVISAYGLFLFTAVAGRLFCGYACPQTVYTQIFMWIENTIEGDRAKRMKLDARPMDGHKFMLKTLKISIWLLFSLWTSITLVGYFTPIKELMHGIATFDLGPWETFWILFYAGFAILQAGFLREQVCKYMCPYARFQGVMFDPDTLVISYDSERGEPRGARKKSETGHQEGKGDCVDCGICVQVCPTGIDIREGLQYECIGCSACIDACDGVMDKIGLPKGLIRYSTENALDKHYTKAEILRHIFRPRIALYTAILGVIIVVSGWSLAHRIPLKVDVIRDRGALAREADDGRTENVYTLRIMNTDESARNFELSVTGLDGIELIGDKVVQVPGATTNTVLLSVRVNPEVGKKGTNQIFFDVKSESDSSVSVHEKAAFIQP